MTGPLAVGPALYQPQQRSKRIMKSHLGTIIRIIVTLALAVWLLMLTVEVKRQSRMRIAPQNDIVKLQHDVFDLSRNSVMVAEQLSDIITILQRHDRRIYGTK
jgi:hypothetical protein